MKRYSFKLAVCLLMLVAECVAARLTVVQAATTNTWTCSTSDSAGGCASSAIAPMSSVRAGLGLDSNSTGGLLYAIGGQSGASTYVGKNQDYSPTGNAWSADRATGSARTAGAMAVTSSGVIYWIGGSNGSYLSKAQAYSTQNDSWTNLAGLPTARAYMGGAVGSDGMIYVIGGENSAGYLTTVEAYDPTSGNWYCSVVVSGCTVVAKPPNAMPTARANFAMVEDANGLIYVIGGQTGPTTYTNVVEAYNPSTQQWTCSIGDTATGCSSNNITPMPTARAVDGDTSANGLIYLIGGNNASNLNAVEIFNPTTNTWACSVGDTSSGCTSTSIMPLPTPRAGAAVAVASDGQVYVVGGFISSYQKIVEAYDPPTVPSAPTAFSATVGSSTATVSWTASTSNGGLPISGYTVTCAPSCIPVTVPSSSTVAIVSGLTNGTSYTFTVVATNFIGSSSGSSSSSYTPATCSLGAPSLSGALPGSLSATLNGADQTVYTGLSSYTAGDSACGGWNITFQASPFTCTSGNGKCPAGGDSLALGSFQMAAPTVSCGSGSSCAGVTGPPTIAVSGMTTLDSGTAVKIASAATNTGEGSYTLAPGIISGTSNNLALTVPSYAYAATYNSTLTVSIVSGP